MSEALTHPSIGPSTPPATSTEADRPAPVAEGEWDIPIPDVSDLIIQDDTPVDNVLHEKQMRLLTEPLYSNWHPGKPFLALANVGLFHEPKQTPVVPDVMLSTNVELPADWREHKKHLSYFVWERGKAPDVVIEIISNKRGGELEEKMVRYAQVGVPFYMIYDPGHFLIKEDLRGHILVGGSYEPLPSPYYFKMTQIGLVLWEGTFEGQEDVWLRWADESGNAIPTGAEQAQLERERAERESERAERESERAERESERAEQEKRLREEALVRLAELEARLKSLEAANSE